MLPLYSHQDYSPRPAVVYVRHEDEANELVQSLSGCVLPSYTINFIRLPVSVVRCFDAR